LNCHSTVQILFFFYFTDGMLDMASMPNGNLTSLTNNNY
jgi:hypothetical protein